MMKIRAVMIFAMVQAALAKEHTSGRSADAVNTADPAIRCNRNAVTNSLSNTSHLCVTKTTANLNMTKQSTSPSTLLASSAAA